MAAPSEVTIENLSGKYTMNKSLSDSQEAFFALQGLGWMTRKTIGLATVTLIVKVHPVDDTVHIDITSSASGLSSTQENRVLDWSEREHSDKLFGNVKGRSKPTNKSDFKSALDGITEDEKKFLLGQQLKNGSDSAFLEDELIQSVVTSQDSAGWSAEQVWGFETINGERRYTRRVIGKSKDGKKTEKMRLVYDYNGPLAS